MMSEVKHLPQPLATLPPRIHGFQLISLIGDGGMGTVYKGTETATGRTVAVKVMNPALLTDSEMLLRFQREVRAATILDHPNIVAVLDAGQTEEVQYLVMEFVEGIDLEQLVARAGHLAVDRACEYIREAALWLGHAHERGIVHRDIKPSNLMVGRDDGVVKILDMGLARLLEPLDGSASALLTHTGAFLGTADFVAPEQALDARHADHRADLYSLGCTLYYLLTGAVPFPGGQTLEKLDRHCWDRSIPVTALRPDVPGAVGRVVTKLMARRPEDRYQSAADAAADLLDFNTPSAVLCAAAATPSSLTDPNWLSPEDLQMLSSAKPAPVDPSAVGEVCCWE